MRSELASPSTSSRSDAHRVWSERYQGLVAFTRALVRNRGHVTDKDRMSLEASGFTPDQIFEIIVGVALKTITNFVGGVFDLPVDEQFQAYAWTKEEDRAATDTSAAAAA